MRLLLVLFLSGCFVCTKAQQLTIEISAGEKKAVYKLNDDSDNRTFVLPVLSQNLSDKFLNLKINGNSESQTTKRAFFIYNENDSAIIDFKKMMQDEYCIELFKLNHLLKKNETYYIYTTQVLSENTRLTVRPSKKLVCKLIIQ